MNINDETLSAFLDGELQEAEMEIVRRRLNEDKSLSQRLAELAAVDRAVESYYSRIDQRPMPDSVRALLTQSPDSAAPLVKPKENPAKVLTFPGWRRNSTNAPSRQRTAIAAAVALVIGFSAAKFFPGNSASKTNWQMVSSALENAAGGKVTEFGNSQQLTPHLTFLNQQGEYCRYFQLNNRQGVSENIACRTADEQAESNWHLVASIELNTLPDPSRYQTASGGSLLDGLLDQIMVGDAVTADTEETLIQQGWPDER